MAAMQEKEKQISLEEICKNDSGAFVVPLMGNVYCKLALGGRRILCEHLSYIRDHNGMLNCMNPIYEKLIQDYQPDKKIN